MLTKVYIIMKYLQKSFVLFVLHCHPFVFLRFRAYRVI